MWHLGMWLSGALSSGGLGLQLHLVILRVFSTLSDSVILLPLSFVFYLQALQQRVASII